MPTFKLARKASLHQNPVVGTSYCNTGYVAENQDNTKQSKNIVQADASNDKHIVQLQQENQVVTWHRDQGTETDISVHVSIKELHDTNIITSEDVNKQPIKAEKYASDINESVIIADNYVSDPDGERKPEDVCVKKEDEDEADVPDGGWGYLVVMGCFISLIILAIHSACSGFLYSDFLLKLKTSSTIVSWIYSTQFIIINLTKPLMGPLIEVMGWRKIMFASGILLGIGTCLSSFATSASFLFFSHCLLTGIATGANRIIILTIIPAYFKRRRGRANAFALCGRSVALIIGPLLITFLQEQFGYQGATLIIGALSFNGCVAAAVFHPVEWHTRHLVKAPVNSEDRKLNFRAAIIRTMAKDLTIIKSRQAIIISIAHTSAMGCAVQIFTMVPFVMKSRGFTQIEASWCMSLASICILVTSLMASSLTDCSWFNIRVCYMTGLILMVGVILAYSFVRSLALTGVVLGAWGVGNGICNSLFPFIVISFLGLKKLSPVAGLSGLFNCAWTLCVGPLFGVLADATGSYMASLVFTAASLALGFILWMFMPIAAAFDHRAEAQRINLRQTTIE